MTRKTWRYCCPSRPPAPGCVPKEGLVGVNWGEGYYVPAAHMTWGYVVYDRMLSDEELDQYELIPVLEVERNDD